MATILLVVRRTDLAVSMFMRSPAGDRKSPAILQLRVSIRLDSGRCFAR